MGTRVTNRGAINLSFEAQDVGSLHAEVLRKCVELTDCIIEMQRYLDVRIRLCDWHGVMDASADIRELQAKAEVLTAMAVALGKVRRR